MGSEVKFLIEWLSVQVFMLPKALSKPILTYPHPACRGWSRLFVLSPDNMER